MTSALCSVTSVSAWLGPHAKPGIREALPSADREGGDLCCLVSPQTKGSSDNAVDVTREPRGDHGPVTACSQRMSVSLFQPWALAVW